MKVWLACVLVVGMAGVGRGGVAYTVTPLTGAGFSFGTGQSIGNDGTIVATSGYSASHPTGQGEAALISADGSVQVLTDSVLGRSSPKAVNASGLVAGDVLVTGQRPLATVWQNGQPSFLPVLNAGEYADANGVNGSGAIAGTEYVGGAATAVEWVNGSVQDLSVAYPVIGPKYTGAAAINDAGKMVVSGNAGAFVLWNGTATPITDPTIYAQGVTGNAINAEGQVGGMADPKSGVGGLAFIWTNGKMAIAPAPAGASGNTIQEEVEALNDDGVGVGFATTRQLSAPTEYAFIWNGSGDLVNLNTLIDPSSGWYLGDAYGINDTGQIVGEGELNGKAMGYLLTPVMTPEVSTGWVVLAGMAGGVLVVRKIRH